MNFIPTFPKLTLFFIVLFTLAKPVNAQYISNYDKYGNQRTSSDKAAEEARNKQNNVQYQPAKVNTPPTKITPIKTRAQIAEEKEEALRKQTLQAERNKRIEEENIRLAQLAKERLIVFNQKVSKYDFVDTFSIYNPILRVALNKKYGYINALGDEVVPLIYDSTSSFFSGRARVKAGNKWGYINTTGAVVIPLQYESAGDFNRDGLSLVKLNKKYGYINSNGQTIIPIKYEDVLTATYYSYYPVKLNGLWGYVDKTGTTFIDHQFDKIISDFSVHNTKDFPVLAEVVKDGAKFKINTSGRSVGVKTDMITGKSASSVLQTGSFTDARDNKVYGTIKIGDQIWMSENLDVTMLTNGEKIPEARSSGEWERAGKKEKAAWCYFNNDAENGKKFGKLYNYYAVAKGLAPEGWHIPSEEEWEKLLAYLGKGKVAAQKMKHPDGWLYNFNDYAEEKCGFIGKPSGARAYENKFSLNGYSAEWWGINDLKFLYRASFALGHDDITRNAASPTYGLSVRCIKNDNVMLSTKTVVVSNDKYNYDKNVQLEPVKKDNKWGFANETGEIVLQPNYDYAYPFRDGLAAVFVNRKYGFIDGMGNTIVPVVYEAFSSMAFVNGYIAAKLNGKWGYIDIQNNIVAPFMYDEIGNASNDMSPVKLNGKWGYIDGKGTVRGDIKYDEVDFFHKGAGIVKVGSKYGLVDIYGKEIIPPIYDMVNYFSDKETAKVVLNKETLYIDRKGNRVSE